VLKVCLIGVSRTIDCKTDIKMFCDNGNVFINHLMMISED
jgi:hypothetical protein